MANDTQVRDTTLYAIDYVHTARGTTLYAIDCTSIERIK